MADAEEDLVGSLPFKCEVRHDFIVGVDVEPRGGDEGRTDRINNLFDEVGLDQNVAGCQLVTDPIEDLDVGDECLRDGWTSPVFVDTQRACFEAFPNASGLTPPRWLWRRVRGAGSIARGESP
jgi:hypothetical protein